MTRGPLPAAAGWLSAAVTRSFPTRGGTVIAARITTGGRPDLTARDEG